MTLQRQNQLDPPAHLQRLFPAEHGSLEQRTCCCIGQQNWHRSSLASNVDQQSQVPLSLLRAVLPPLVRARLRASPLILVRAPPLSCSGRLKVHVGRGGDEAAIVQPLGLDLTSHGDGCSMVSRRQLHGEHMCARRIVCLQCSHCGRAPSMFVVECVYACNLGVLGQAP